MSDEKMTGQSEEMNVRFRTALKSIRENHHFTLQGLQDVTGVSATTYSFIERGKQHPTRKFIENLTKKLSLTAEEYVNLSLLGGYIPDLELVNPSHVIDPNPDDLTQEVVESLTWLFSDDGAHLSPKGKVIAQTMLSFLPETIKKLGYDLSHTISGTINIEDLQPKPEAKGSKKPSPYKQALSYLEQINLLRSQGMGGRQIAESLQLTYGTYQYYYGLLKEKGEIIPKKKKKLDYQHTTTNYYETRRKLIDILNSYLQDHPGERINLKQISIDLGVSRERVRQLYNKIAETQPVPEILHPRTKKTDYSRIDQEIFRLARNKYTRDEMSTLLTISRNAVNASIRRLQKSGKLGEITLPKRSMILNYKIAILRNKQLDSQTIANKLGISRTRVQHILSGLMASNKVERIRRPRRSSQQVITFYEEVKKLRESGLKIKEIASKLQVPIFDVMNAVKNLIDMNQIERKSVPVARFADLKQYIQPVLDLRKRGYTRAQMSQELGIPISSINIVSNHILANDLAPRLVIPTSEIKRLTPIIEELILNGETNAQIATRLNLNHYTVQYIRTMLTNSGRLIKGHRYYAHKKEEQSD